MIRIRARYLHAIESATNVTIGYLINLVLVQILLHMLGYEIRLQENALMGMILACVAFVRGYWVRRIFNFLVYKVYKE